MNASPLEGYPVLDECISSTIHLVFKHGSCETVWLRLKQLVIYDSLILVCAGGKGCIPSQTERYLQGDIKPFLNEVIPFCINSIYLFYHIFPSTQHTSFEFTATCSDLTSHLQAYS